MKLFGRVTTLAAILGSLGLLLTYGCAFSPTAPFEGFDGEASDGITLSGSFASQGTFNSRAGNSLAPAAWAQSISPSDCEGMTVEVVGTDIIVDVVSCSFTLRGLPEGSFEIQFRDENGDPMGDPIPFDQVLPNQQITVVVALDGDAVTVLEERRNGIGHGDIEIEGIASDIQTEGEDTNNGTLVVDGYNIMCANGMTAVRKGNRRLYLTDIEEGDRVHVKGVWDTTNGGSQDVLAHEIKLQEEVVVDPGEPSPTACTYVDPDKPNHILVCHNGRTLSISPDAWPGHAGHGDTCGPCGS